MGRQKRIWRVGALAVAVLWALAAEPRAQVADPLLAPEMDASFSRMLRDPGNLELTFAYAGIAARAGNYEGAIAALERMLLIEPDLPRVRLELGVLYFRLESLDLARSYFVAALAGDTVPDDVRSRVAQFLAEIDKRQSRHKFSGSVLTGLRYQTNANSGYGSEAVPIPAIAGNDPVDAGSGRRDDWNLFSALTATHVFDMGGQRNESWETGFSLYGTRQNHVHALNTALAEVSSGPRFSLADAGLEFGTLRPYALANLVTLKDNRYFHSGGGGLQFQNPLAGNLLLALGYETRTKNYRTDASRRTVRLQNGTEHAATAGLTYVLTARDSFSANASASRDLARSGVKRVDRRGFTLGYTRKQPPPAWLGSEPWSLSATAGRHLSDYRSPDGTIDADTRRGDREWRYSALVGVPLTDSLSGVVVVQRQTVSSSYLINKYRNESVTLGISKIF